MRRGQYQTAYFQTKVQQVGLKLGAWGTEQLFLHSEENRKREVGLISIQERLMRKPGAVVNPVTLNR